LRLLGNPLPADDFLFNIRFGTCLVVAACAGASLWFAANETPQLSDLEKTGVAVLGVSLNVLMLAALTSEVSLFFRGAPQEGHGFRDVQSMDDRLAEGLSISLLWAVYGSALVFAGVRWSSRVLRWQGLALLGITTLKVFFNDLGMLSGFYRVVSSIAQGVVLLVISYLYQRRMMARAPEAR
jgi:uncharacterized membrane protein